jgi:hypothetical protein
MAKFLALLLAGMALLAIATALPYTVCYNGKVYRTLDKVDLNNTAEHNALVNDFKALPVGYSVAFDNEDSRQVTALFTWGANVLVTENGATFYTKAGGFRNGKSAGYGPGDATNWLSKIFFGNLIKYAPLWDTVRVLIYKDGSCEFLFLCCAKFSCY